MVNKKLNHYQNIPFPQKKIFFAIETAKKKWGFVDNNDNNDDYDDDDDDGDKEGARVAMNEGVLD